MLKEMIKYKNSVYEMYGDRNKRVVIENFLKGQREKTKRTKKDVKF